MCGTLNWVILIFFVVTNTNINACKNLKYEHRRKCAIDHDLIVLEVIVLDIALFRYTLGKSLVSSCLTGVDNS